MPNRMIKESLLVSDKISELTDFQFRLWVSLILLSDDCGRGDARPAIIKGRAFPLRDRVTVKDVQCSLESLAACGCVSLYKVGGKPYWQFLNWSQHQRLRNTESKYPSPDDADICGNSPQVAASCGELRPEEEVEVEAKKEVEAEEKVARVRAKNNGGDAARPSFDTLGVYAANNLARLTPGNMDDIMGWAEDFPEEVIRFAIDKACGAGKNTWNYTRAILSAWEKAGVKTLGDAKAEAEKHGKGKTPAQEYQQHTYSEAEEAEFFFDPTKGWGA